MSSTRQLATSGSLLLSSSGAEPNSSTRRSTDRNRLASALRTEASSSTTKTIGRDCGSSFFIRQVIAPLTSHSSAKRSSQWRPAGDWQSELKRPAVSAGIGRGPYPSAVRFDDRTANRQSHAQAVLFGGEECVEKTIRVLWRDADAGVPHLDQHLIGIMTLRSDRQLAGSVGDGRH